MRFFRKYPKATGQSFALGAQFRDAMVQRFEPVTEVEEACK